MEINTPLFIVIDEAQVAAEHLKFFRSESGTALPTVEMHEGAVEIGGCQMRGGT